MKKLFLIYTALFLGMFNIIFSANNILNPDVKLNRKASILANVVVVRYKPEFKSENSVLAFNSKLKLINSEPILRKDISLTFKNNLTKEDKLLSYKDYSNIIKAEEPLLRSYILKYENNISPEDYCEYLLKTFPEIEIAEPYYVYELSWLPNDTYVNIQMSVLEQIHAPEAWDVLTGDSTVIIGISDSGLMQNHEDIKDAIATNFGEIPGDGIDNDKNGYIDDYFGYNFAFNEDGVARDNTSTNIAHGTEVAGIAGAKSNNNIGIAGVGNRCRIFPLKIIANGSLTYSYQSFAYAAVRGIKVLNCSWGSPGAFSSINQSLIDFAVSKGVSIVVAGGNKGTNGASIYDTFYPGAYKNVLAVGEVNINDFVTSSSVIGLQTRIMAPGIGNYSTELSGYSYVSGGSSYATPVVSGAVALARSKYPNLNAIQAIEFVRQCTDDIAALNTSDQSLIPGRINLSQIATKNPFSIPAIVPQNIVYFNKDMFQTNRFRMGDEVNLNIKAYNHLAEAKNLRFVLSVAYDPIGSIEITKNTIENIIASRESNVDIDGFQLSIKSTYKSFVILRIDIYGENSYHDFFKFNFIPTSDISTFSNNSITFSVSDFGEFGFTKTGQNVIGSGFSYKNYGNQIYRYSGLMVSEDSKTLSYVSTVDSRNDFNIVKSFISPNPNIGIVNDSNSPNPIGIKITQETSFISQDANSVRIKLQLQNTNPSRVLKNVAVGYFLDWDIGGSTYSKYNKVKLFDDAVPSALKGKAASGEIAYISTVPEYPVFGMASYSGDKAAVAQAAGLHYGTTQNFDDTKRILALNSATNWQTDTTYDISMVVGTKFIGDIPIGGTKECVVCIAGAENTQKLAKELGDCLQNSVGVKENVFNTTLNIYPNPATEFAELKGKINFSSMVSLEIVDLFGNHALDPIEFEAVNGDFNINLNLSKLQSGVYLAILKSDKDIQALKFQVIK